MQDIQVGKQPDGSGMDKRATYQMTYHVCRTCGSGRILRQTNAGPTGGGNPVWKCSTCKMGGAAIGPDVYCYCGHSGRQGEQGEWSCISKDQEIPDGWRSCKILYDLRVIKRNRVRSQ